uniref:tRNA:m(4)X modification enzyme TRM13 n=1 Tax=Chenopodium quinoa TaxID=63459 RepID=A0A803NAW7_CHEQI
MVLLCYITWSSFYSDFRRKLPYQEKHVRQQASILGNLEDFGVLSEQYCQSDLSAVVEFGAGRGNLRSL